jgi:hypothetical protein
LWSTPGNWQQNAVPGLGTTANFRNDYPAGVIDANTNAYCTTLYLGYNTAGVDCRLNVEGGSLSIAGYLEMGRLDNGISTLTVTDGVINCGALRAWTGDHWVEMTGGEFNCAGTLEIPRSYASVVTAKGVFRLHGGIVRAKDIVLNANPIVLCRFDITKGKLILDGDARTKVNGYIAAGLMTAYYDWDADVPSATASISMAYDAGTNKTTVIACEQQLQADFNADCVVDELDLALLMSDWGYQTPNEITWDFDMSTDPVGPNTMDLKVRSDGNGNYSMDDMSGTLEVLGALLLDEQVDTSGLWDTDVHVVVKATSVGIDNALRFWSTMSMSSEPSSQAYLGFSLYVDDAGKQTLELWNGTPPHDATYLPIIVTGFAADTMIDLTLHYDYETDTFDWTATDGTLTESGTDVPYTAYNTGVGGSYTIQGLAGTVATIDQFTYTIHGSSLNSPYDINLDGVVNQLDLDILEAEMAQ